MLDGSRFQRARRLSTCQFYATVSSRDDFLFRGSPAEDIFIIFSNVFRFGTNPFAWMNGNWFSSQSLHTQFAETPRVPLWKIVFRAQIAFPQFWGECVESKVWLLNPKKMSSSDDGTGGDESKANSWHSRNQSNSFFRSDSNFTAIDGEIMRKMQ